MLVAIGASTGGPGAILEILRSLPAEFGLPILLVLHINEPFGAAFADWLDAQTGRPVAYARDGAPVAAAAGRVVVAPGGPPPGRARRPSASHRAIRSGIPAGLRSMCCSSRSRPNTAPPPPPAC